MKITSAVILFLVFTIAVLLPSTATASSSETIASGRLEYYEPFGGPATMTFRRLIIEPGETLGWHAHPGIGAYTVVKRGTLTIEDGCGGETVYHTGDAFIEHPDRVHRGKNLGSDQVETIQLFVVPEGTPLSHSSGKACGAPAATAECRLDGWMTFTYPKTFTNQGDCTQFVMTGH